MAQQRGDVVGTRGRGDGEPNAPAPRLLEEPPHAGPQRDPGGDEGGVVPRFFRMQPDYQIREIARCPEIGPVPLHVMADPLLAPGDRQQVPVQRHVPHPIEPRLGERPVESHAVPVALAVGERAVHVEDERLGDHAA